MEQRGDHFGVVLGVRSRPRTSVNVKRQIRRHALQRVGEHAETLGIVWRIRQELNLKPSDP